VSAGVPRQAGEWDVAVRTDGASRRAQIIDVAARLFEEHGYHETTMEMLAQEVGVKKASLYYYFASKDLILVDIHEEMIDHLLEAADRRDAAAADPVDRLHGIITDLVALMELFPGRLRIFFEHYRELPVEQRAAIQVKRNRYQGVLVTALRGVRGGRRRADRPGRARHVQLDLPVAAPGRAALRPAGRRPLPRPGARGHRHPHAARVGQRSPGLTDRPGLRRPQRMASALTGDPMPPVSGSGSALKKKS